MSTNPNMEAIQTVTVSATSAANITFSNIPQTYTDLVVKLSVRTTDTQDTGNVGMNMKINTATTGYTGRVLYGYGSTNGSYQSNSQSIGTIVSGGAGVTSMFSNHEVYIPNYAGSTAKSYSVDAVSNVNSTTLSEADLIAKGQSSTSAITDLTFTCASGNFVQYSTATLYGVTNAAVGAKATGGIISETNTHWIHTFTASGTFTPTVNLTADYLVVAGGGGGGGFYRGGGGGAGGLRSTVTATGGGGSLESALSLTSGTSYTVTVGAGGTGAFNENGNNGNDSVFSTITSNKGGGGGKYQANANSGTFGSGGGGGGAGATGSSPYTNGNPGTANTGGGGGGGNGETSGTNGVGGNGGSGIVIVRYAK